MSKEVQETIKHSPGPWRVSEFERAANGNTRMIMGADDFSVTWVGERTAEENEANARLISAAPDLLKSSILQEAAEDHWANCEDCEGSPTPELGCEVAFKMADDARLMRRAAIAKATGGGE